MRYLPQFTYRVPISIKFSFADETSELYKQIWREADSDAIGITAGDDKVGKTAGKLS